MIDQAFGAHGVAGAAFFEQGSPRPWEEGRGDRQGGGRMQGMLVLAAKGASNTPPFTARGGPSTRTGTHATPHQSREIMMDRAKLIGINHISLEVGDVDDALAFFRRIFKLELRGTSQDDEGRVAMAFIDMGDQFLTLIRGRRQAPDEGRHFGLVVDDRTSVRKLAEEARATIVEGRSLDFLDPWGNRIEVVEYADMQFSKTDAVMRAMGLQIDKRAQARQELREKGMKDE